MIPSPRARAHAWTRGQERSGGSFAERLVRGAPSIGSCWGADLRKSRAAFPCRARARTPGPGRARSRTSARAPPHNAEAEQRPPHRAGHGTGGSEPKPGRNMLSGARSPTHSWSCSLGEFSGWRATSASWRDFSALALPHFQPAPRPTPPPASERRLAFPRQTLSPKRERVSLDETKTLPTCNSTPTRSLDLGGQHRLCAY
jgi:hypothetical protein